jgi:hypothetical protein
MICEIGGRLLNLALVREVTFTGTSTRLFWSNMGHDFTDVPGDVRPAILSACGDVILKATKRK